MSTYYNWLKTVATNTSTPSVNSHVRAVTSEFYHTLQVHIVRLVGLGDLDLDSGDLSGVGQVHLPPL